MSLVSLLTFCLALSWCSACVGLSAECGIELGVQLTLRRCRTAECSDSKGFLESGVGSRESARVLKYPISKPSRTLVMHISQTRRDCTMEAFSGKIEVRWIQPTRPHQRIILIPRKIQQRCREQIRTQNRLVDLVVAHSRKVQRLTPEGRCLVGCCYARILL